MIRLYSFGYRYHPFFTGVDVTFDVRNLPNPHSVPELRNLNGLDEAVTDWLLNRPVYVNFLKTVIPCLQDNKKYAFGCLGGRHRSVAVAEALGYHLSKEGHIVRVVHHEIKADHIYRNGSEIRHARGPASLSPGSE